MSSVIPYVNPLLGPNPLIEAKTPRFVSPLTQTARENARKVFTASKDEFDSTPTAAGKAGVAVRSLLASVPAVVTGTAQDILTPVADFGSALLGMQRGAGAGGTPVAPAASVAPAAPAVPDASAKLTPVTPTLLPIAPDPPAATRGAVAVPNGTQAAVDAGYAQQAKFAESQRAAILGSIDKYVNTGSVDNRSYRAAQAIGTLGSLPQLSGPNNAATLLARGAENTALIDERTNAAAMQAENVRKNVIPVVIGETLTQDPVTKMSVPTKQYGSITLDGKGGTVTRDVYGRPLSAPQAPSLDTFLKAAGKTNPGMTTKELTAKYASLYQGQ